MVGEGFWGIAGFVDRFRISDNLWFEGEMGNVACGAVVTKVCCYI